MTKRIAYRPLRPSPSTAFGLIGLFRVQTGTTGSGSGAVKAQIGPRVAALARF